MSVPVPPVNPGRALADLDTYVTWSGQTIGALSGQVDSLGAANTSLSAANAQLTTANDSLTAANAQLEEEKAVIQRELDDCKSDPPPPPPGSGSKLGSSFGEIIGPSKVGAARIYDSGDSKPIGIAVDHGVTRISLSSRDDTRSGSTVVSRIKALFAKYPKITEVDYAHENEADRTDHRATNDADMRAWANECKAISDAIYAVRDWGAGRSVKFAVDMTGFGTQQGNSQKMMGYLKAVNCKVEVYGSSMYPPGRNKRPPVKSGFDEFIRPSIDVAAQFGIPFVSCYEIGTPLSSTYDRPSYVATWNPEFVRYAKSKGVEPRDFDYWNGTKDTVDNRFQVDGSTTTVVGKTEKAFFASSA